MDTEQQEQQESREPKRLYQVIGEQIISAIRPNLNIKSLTK
jgi:hypothetical protein